MTALGTRSMASRPCPSRSLRGPLADPTLCAYGAQRLGVRASNPRVPRRHSPTLGAVAPATLPVVLPSSLDDRAALRWLVVGLLVTALGHKKSSARSSPERPRYRFRVDSARVQARPPTCSPHCGKSHDPGRRACSIPSVVTSRIRHSTRTPSPAFYPRLADVITRQTSCTGSIPPVAPATSIRC
jgi:hypothetical protein